MVERRMCNFCGNEIEPGTGRMYVKKDGTIFHFCKAKCQKNMLYLKRIPRNVRWTKKYVKGGA
ncbi:MAG: 50S ribosomal protein L24e [Thermoplasmata archaeon]